MSSETAVILTMVGAFLGGPLFCAGCVWLTGTSMGWVRENWGLLGVAGVGLVAWLALGLFRRK